MENHNGRPQWRPDDDSDRSLSTSLRLGTLLALSLPATLASLVASATSQGPPLWLAGLMAGVVSSACGLCWWRVIRLWRALRRRDDEDFGGPGGSGDDRPRDPDDGPGGIRFDWPAFEQQFWAYVEHARELVPAGA